MLIILLLLFSIYSTDYSQNNIIPVKEIINLFPKIQYQKCFEEISFNFKRFPLNTMFPNEGFYQEAFILSIPNGKVQGIGGIVFVGNNLIKETIRNEQWFYNYIQPIQDEQCIKVMGTVAVIAQIFPYNYYHTILDTLARLALLEMNNVEYDWIYIPQNTPYIKELIKIWGIDPLKIIVADHHSNIQADKLIITSELCNVIPCNKDNGSHMHPHTTHFIRNKLLSILQNDIYMLKNQFCKRVFISRKDAPMRKILNEDEVFLLFEQIGFKRYEMSKLSVVEQIALFHNAEIIVAEHGAALVNMIFCQSNTPIIEIVQNLPNNCFWWLSQILHLKHTLIQTIKIDLDEFGKPLNPNHNWYDNAIIPLDKIYDIIDFIEKGL